MTNSYFPRLTPVQFFLEIVTLRIFFLTTKKINGSFLGKPFNIMEFIKSEKGWNKLVNDGKCLYFWKIHTIWNTYSCFKLLITKKKILWWSIDQQIVRNQLTAIHSIVFN